MTAATAATPFSVRLVNFLLGIRPLFALAKHRARSMMLQRAKRLGIPWEEKVQAFQNEDWTAILPRVQRSITYPDYYLKPFHAYDEGNMGWTPAWECESAALTVHATLWGGERVDGDRQLRDNYHRILAAQLPTPPAAILDLGCSVGMSTAALKALYPEAAVTGLDLSPYFLAVAQQTYGDGDFHWHHAAAETTGLPDASFDLVATCLMFHELPQEASRAILREARRLLKPGGHFALMDMNPQSKGFATMPPQVLTLLKSTEPYLDQYLTFDLAGAIEEAGFQTPIIQESTPRHRTVIAQVA